MCRGSSERMGINYRYAHVLIKSETNHQMSRTTIMYLNTIEVNVFSIARNNSPELKTYNVLKVGLIWIC